MAFSPKAYSETFDLAAPSVPKVINFTVQEGSLLQCNIYNPGAGTIDSITVDEVNTSIPVPSGLGTMTCASGGGKKSISAKDIGYMTFRLTLSSTAGTLGVVVDIFSRCA